MTMPLYLETIGISLVVAIIVAVVVAWIDRERRRRAVLKWYAKPSGLGNVPDHANITLADPVLPTPKPKPRRSNVTAIVKLTPEAHCALGAYADAHDMDKSEVVRDILHKWALKQIHGASVLHRCLRAQGITGEDQGVSGKPALDFEK